MIHPAATGVNITTHLNIMDGALIARMNPQIPTIRPMPKLAPVALATSKPVGLNIGGFVTWAQSGHLPPTGEVTRQRGQISSSHFPHRRLVSTAGSRGQCLINVLSHGLNFLD